VFVIQTLGPFAGGEAHHKMVDMAERTWEVAGPYVVNALQQNKDYSLTLTGHSLGAGVACLVSILCHQRGRKRVLGRNVQCFAYGCPPVFTSPELVPDTVKHTTAYIHGNDGIPFLSLSHVRRLVSKLQWMMEDMSSPTKLPLQNVFKALKRIGIVYPNTMNTVIPIPGSPILFVPASTIVWTKKVDNGKFDAKFCDPRKVAGLEIPLSANYLNDHSLTSYEGALQYLVEKNDVSF
jgi:Lipase (class 3)